MAQGGARIWDPDPPISGEKPQRRRPLSRLTRAKPPMGHDLWPTSLNAMPHCAITQRRAGFAKGAPKSLSCRQVRLPWKFRSSVICHLFSMSRRRGWWNRVATEWWLKQIQRHSSVQPCALCNERAASKIPWSGPRHVWHVGLPYPPSHNAGRSHTLCQLYFHRPRPLQIDNHLWPLRPGRLVAFFAGQADVVAKALKNNLTGARDLFNWYCAAMPPLTGKSRHSASCCCRRALQGQGEWNCGTGPGSRSRARFCDSGWNAQKGEI